MSENLEKRDEHQHHLIHFEVDDEPYTTKNPKLTPKEIMVEFAAVDPAIHYLVEIRGKGEDGKSFEGKPEEPIHMHDGLRFITICIGPMPVS